MDTKIIKLKKSNNQLLKQAFHDGEIVRIMRDNLEDGWVNGYILGLGDTHVAIEVFDKSGRLDGINCLRIADISECILPAPYHEFLTKNSSLKNMVRQKIFDVDISNLKTILSTAGNLYPLVTIHFEDNDDVCYIGKYIALNGDTLTLKDVTPGGEWCEESNYCLNEITRVDFGGEYEAALYRVAQSRMPS